MPVTSDTTLRSGPDQLAASGAGSTAIEADSPCSRQPASIALPMRPQPTNRIGGMLIFRPDLACSCFAHAFQHGGRQRVLRRLAAPKHELERGEKPLALGQRDIDHIF